MKTPIEMLTAIIKMQEANYGNGINTHMKLSTLTKEAKEVVENFHTSNIDKSLNVGGVVSAGDYKHIWHLMDQLNTIMWESYMAKGKGFGRQEGDKIMKLLEQWSERH